MSTLVTRPLDPQRDQAGLIALFDQVFGGTVTPAMWYWKYVPPWAPRFYCWVALAGDQVIGYVGALPLRGQIDGRPVPFFQLADVMVHPAHRLQHDYFSLGTRHILEDISTSHPQHVVYGFSGHRAFRWFERLGISGLVERAHTRYVPPGPPPTGREVQLRDWGFDAPEVDAVWRQGSGLVRTGLIRDGAYLRWRYGSHPVNGYRLVGVQRGSEPIGYLVIGTDPPGVGGRAAETPVVDLLLPPEATRPALAALARRLGRPVMLWLPGWLAQQLPELGDGTDSGTHVYHFVKQSMVDTAHLRQHLYYTMGDVDWW